jgi:2-phosphosulfolactate phosphatase
VRLDVAFTPGELRGGPGARTVVVIDVLRATSTITEALVNGARSVLPVATVEDAARMAEQIGRDAVVLCGERDTQPIAGFHLGNSPLEFTAERIAGRTLVMTTTNGTVALLAAAPAPRCYLGSLLNVTALAERLAGEREDVLLLCSGRKGAFALEDAYCAGRIARQVGARVARLGGNDAAGAAVRLARRAPSAELLGRTAAGRRLKQLGRQEDVAFCALEDRHAAVPVFDAHRVRLQDRAA